MPDIALQTLAPAPLSSFTEDEILFRDNVRQFAEEKVRPLAREMDERGVFDKSLIEEFFHLGLMGIEIPEEYGGAGGKFFEAILAVEELSRADASAGVGHCGRLRVERGWFWFRRVRVTNPRPTQGK